MNTSLGANTGFATGLVWATPEQAAQAARAAGHGPDIAPAPHTRHEWARHALTAPPILTVVQNRIGPAVAVIESTLLLRKKPRAFVVPPHQDGIDARWELAPDRAVSVWFALTDATIASGCVRVVPSSHGSGYQPHIRAPHDPGRGAPLTLATAPAENRYVPVPVRAGHALLMDVRLIHRSDINTTGQPRIGFNAVYVAPGAVRLHHGQPPATTLLTGDRSTT
ncbi:phytanoyl-CoA dioxygenase [Actinomadura logoneensis]|uniref:Phytanoyl-CoA dioxygenase n=1 Tax=Actinomadura logoneensis TaxID=2293572 RepID=A0A372JNK0_9ACTN|nr:phytanoyl-CoA dioxygenase family protein [Actinomadura logoneensis]RFU41376.1 phytanoyl-CoA dioxygenase [Actinomadura logoneensis]